MSRPTPRSDLPPDPPPDLPPDLLPDLLSLDELCARVAMSVRSSGRAGRAEVVAAPG